MPELPPVRVVVNVEDKGLSKSGDAAELASKKIAESMAGASTATQNLEARHVALHDASRKVAGAHEDHGHTMEALEGKAKSFGGVLGNLGPIGSKAAGGLGEVTEKASGMAGALGPVAGVVAGVGLAVVAFAAEVTEKYLHLSEQVHNYMRVTGASAEVASRQVEAFNVLGVSADTATSAMVKLSKGIDQHPAKLQAVGVELAKDAQGNTDLSRTLGNVADAYNATEDPAKRMTIVLTAFGKAGAGMIPILEEGSAGLAKLEQQARMVFSDADIKRAHEYEIQQREVKKSTDALGESMGGKFLPIQAAATTAYLESEYVTAHMDEAMKKANVTGGAHSRAVQLVTQSLREEYHAGREADKMLDEAKAAHKAAGLAADEHTKALESLYAVQDQETHALLAFERANLGLVETADAAKLAQDAQTAAIRDYGPASDQAHQATIALFKAQMGSADAALADAKAQVDLASAQAAAAGGALSAAQKHDLEVAALGRMAAALAPGSDLRNRLDSWILRLGETPKDVFTTLHLDTDASGGVSRGALSGADLSRPIPAAPAIAVPTSPSAPPGPPALAAGLGASSGQTNNITVNQQGTNFTPAQTAQEIAWQFKTAVRA